MRHHKTGRKFGRERKVRNALLKSLALSLIVHEKITTTEAKAKELRPLIEKLITMGKTDTLSAKRLIVARLMNRKKESKKLLEKIVPKYKERKGGYVRIIKLPRRLSDASKMAIIEFV
jgi:large subunit ribosomal protein L17